MTSVPRQRHNATAYTITSVSPNRSDFNRKSCFFQIKIPLSFKRLRIKFSRGNSKKLGNLFYPGYMYLFCFGPLANGEKIYFQKGVSRLFFRRLSAKSALPLYIRAVTKNHNLPIISPFLFFRNKIFERRFYGFRYFSSFSSEGRLSFRPFSPNPCRFLPFFGAVDIWLRKI